MNSYELINTCSTFMLFYLIRKCGRQRSDYREATATTESTTTTETRKATEARATVAAQSNKQQAQY